MSFFKKIKTDIGIDDQEEDNKAEEKTEEVSQEVKKDKSGDKKEKKVVGERETEIKEKEKGSEKENQAKEDTSKKDKKGWLKAEGQLAVDVYYTDSEFVVQSPIAGISLDEIDIEAEEDMITIKGERKQPETEIEKKYIHKECYWGLFSRQIMTPENVDTENTKASFKEGVLTIRIPKIVKVKSKKINISVK